MPPPRRRSRPSTPARAGRTRAHAACGPGSHRGRLATVPEALALPDPLQGLDAIIDRFCEFWSSDEAIARLHDAMATDAEFAVALAARHERRRKLLQALMKRLVPAQAAARQRRDAVDFAFAMTSFAMFRLLGANRSPHAVAALVKTSCRAVLDASTRA